MNYKELIFDQLGEQLKENDIENVTMQYNIAEHKPSIFAVKTSGEKSNIPLTNTELTTLRLVFVNKVLKQMKKIYPDKTVESLICQLIVSKESFDVFIAFKDEEQLIHLE